jgi:hypothetical protein
MNAAALMLSLLGAGLAAVRPLVLATILGAGAVRNEPTLLESVMRHVVSTLSVEYTTAALLLR